MIGKDNAGIGVLQEILLLPMEVQDRCVTLGKASFLRVGERMGRFKPGGRPRSF